MEPTTILRCTVYDRILVRIHARLHGLKASHYFLAINEFELGLHSKGVVRSSVVGNEDSLKGRRFWREGGRGCRFGVRVIDWRESGILKRGSEMRMEEYEAEMENKDGSLVAQHSALICIASPVVTRSAPMVWGVDASAMFQC